MTLCNIAILLIKIGLVGIPGVILLLIALAKDRYKLGLVGVILAIIGLICAVIGRILLILLL
jgi:uncharacterized membrane protein YqjE